MTAIELELLEEGQAAGKLIFKISKSGGEGVTVEVPNPNTDSNPEPVLESLEQAT